MKDFLWYKVGEDVADAEGRQPSQTIEMAMALPVEGICVTDPF